MGRLTALILILAICAGPYDALPIAAVRPNINFNITLPPETTPQTFVSNRSRNEVFTDVARIMKAAKGSPFRYGKRSFPSEMSAGGILDNPFNSFNYKSKAYAVLPVYEVGLYKNPYSTYFHRKPASAEKPRMLPSFPFSGSFPQFLDSLMFKDRILRMDRLFKTSVPEVRREDSRAELDKLFQMLTVIERAEKDETLHDIHQFYRTSTLTRPRPGKRANFFVPQKMDKVLNAFEKAVVFSNPQRKRSADKTTGKTTVGDGDGGVGRHQGEKNRAHALDKAQGQ
ncbi:hypothetical protein L3Y34_010941 [Caenorhabditis briggsae]|uniref:Uncharacterized protein n=1 Tax=Caenorhabditis briggsae TaxID=6238 RepID=A0AAE9CTT4_CAEBR|nr:hypothetical protein L3Y34_010941 [Caenorhabditis briggsae]